MNDDVTGVREAVLAGSECMKCNSPMKATTRPGGKGIAKFSCTVCPFEVVFNRVAKPGCFCAECKALRKTSSR